MSAVEPEVSSISDSGRTVRAFCVQVMTGSILFLVIGAAAVGLGQILHLLEEIRIDPIVLGGLYLAKYGLFAVDLILFGRFLYVASTKAWRSL